MSVQNHTKRSRRRQTDQVSSSKPVALRPARVWVEPSATIKLVGLYVRLKSLGGMPDEAGYHEYEDALEQPQTSAWSVQAAHLDDCSLNAVDQNRL